MIFHSGYYCLVAGLPELQFDEGKVTASLLTFRDELKSQLAASEYRTVHTLFLPYDHNNLLAFLLAPENKFDPLGNYSPEIFEDQLSRMNAILRQPDLLEPYLVAFLQLWNAEDTVRDALNPGKILLQDYYHHAIRQAGGFLKNWLLFDRDVRNIMTTLLCRKHNLEISGQLLDDHRIVPQLIRNNSRDFGLSAEIEYMERLLQISEISDLMERERRLDLFRWEWIDSLITFHYFDLDVLLAYLLKLQMVLRWARLNKAEGEKMFRELIGKLENSYEFPEDFKRRK